MLHRSVKHWRKEEPDADLVHTISDTVNRENAAVKAECQALLDAYGEPQRHYHTLQHLGECLALADTVKAEAERFEFGAAHRGRAVCRLSPFSA